MQITPVNRHIQIKVDEQPTAERASGIVLPDDYEPTIDRYVIVTVVGYADDVRFCDHLIAGRKILVDQTMIEEITIDSEKITVILDNYVIGIVHTVKETT